MASTGTPATSSEVLSRVQEAWWPIRLGAASIEVRGLDVRTSSGWTYRDLLAHIGAWEDATAERLAAFRGNGELRGPPAEPDVFNARVAAAVRDRPAETVLQELDAAHARLTAEIGSLSDAQLAAADGWAAAIIAGNTYEHYGEHRHEVFTAVPRTPTELLELMDTAWRRFRRDVAHVGLVHGSARSPAGMTYRALLGHVAYWLESAIVELPVRLGGRRSEPPDVDAVNARVMADADAAPTHDVIERLDRAYARVREAVAALASEVPFLAVRLVAGETYDHFRQHRAHVASARPRSAEELLARIDQVWRPFRAAIRGRGRSGLGETVAGLDWTYRDLVAHAAAWMEEVPGALDRIRKGQAAPSWNDETIRAFNERSTESRRLVGAEALLDELDTAHRLLVESTRSLRSEEIASALGVVAFYSYLHWEEHFTHLGIRA